MGTAVCSSGIPVIFGSSSDRSYHYKIERKESGGCQIAAKKTLLGDFSFVEEFEIGCIFTVGMELENIVIMTLFLSPGYVLWKTGVI